MEFMVQTTALSRLISHKGQVIHSVSFTMSFSNISLSEERLFFLALSNQLR